jgi:ribosomal protein L34
MENHRNSNRKKKRSQGFRSRRVTTGGRKVLNRQRTLKAGRKKIKPGKGIKRKTKAKAK